MLIVVHPRAGPAGTLMTRPCRRIRFAVHHDANVRLAPREGRSSGWRPRTLLAARLHRRRLGLRCSRCLRHLMLAVHSTQRTPRLLPDRVVATTASAGCVRPQVPEPCWHRSRPQNNSPYPRRPFERPRLSHALLDHLRQHGAGGRTTEPRQSSRLGCTSRSQCLGVVARSRAGCLTEVPGGVTTYSYRGERHRHHATTTRHPR